MKKCKVCNKDKDDSEYYKKGDCMFNQCKKCVCKKQMVRDRKNKEMNYVY